MPVIERLTALEVLDSRGRPTVRATCVLSGGASASASVPSGVSTGAAEALELRDGDPARYHGLGCRKAVANVRGELNDALAGKKFDGQEARYSKSAAVRTTTSTPQPMFPIALRAKALSSFVGDSVVGTTTIKSRSLSCPGVPYACEPNR